MLSSFVTRLEEINEADEETVATINERRGTDTAQIIVICEDPFRFFMVFFASAMSKALAEAWQENMIDAIETGR
jgi:hypothetical protein